MNVLYVMSCVADKLILSAQNTTLRPSSINIRVKPEFNAQPETSFIHQVVLLTQLSTERVLHEPLKPNLRVSHVKECERLRGALCSIKEGTTKNDQKKFIRVTLPILTSYLRVPPINLTRVA